MAVEENVRRVMGKRRSKWIAPALGISALMAAGSFAALSGLYEYNNRVPDLAIATPVVPAPNGYDDFVRAGKLAQAMKHKSPLDMTGPTEQTHTYANFKACAPEAAIAEAAVREGLHKPYLLPPMRSFTNDRFPDYAGLREVARTLGGKARYEALSGQPAQAMDTLLDGMEMGVMLPRGGNLVSGLVGIAIEAISVRPMEDLIPRLNAAQLAHVAARLDVIAAKRASYADIMQEEGNVSAASLREFFANPNNRGLRGIPSVARMVSGNPEEGKLTWRERWQAAQYLFASKRALLQRHQAYFDALVAEARQPYRGPSRVPVSPDPLAQNLSGVFEHARDKFAAIESVTTLLQTEVALERYRLDNKRYPANLSLLVPAYLKAIPSDACAGRADQPLHYAPRADATSSGGAYLLYSVGPDMRDDGGRPQKSIGDNGGGDLVARHLWPSPPQAKAFSGGKKPLHGLPGTPSH